MKKPSGWRLGCVGVVLIALAAANFVYWSITGKAMMGPRSIAARNALPLFGTIFFFLVGLLLFVLGIVTLLRRKSIARQAVWSQKIPQNSNRKDK